MLTTYQINLNSSTYRLAAQREAGNRQAWLERYLEVRKEFSFTATYKAFEQEYLALMGGQKR